jgi:hypothetical protein
MATGRATQTPNDHLQMALEPATGNPGTLNQMADEECHLLNLPVELQKTIFEYVRTSALSFNSGMCQLTALQLTTNRDKKSACLTCKQMQLLVTPLLYRHMEIGGDDLVDDDFRWSLTRETRGTREHPGLKHVRTLRIVDRGGCHFRGFCGSIGVICHLLNTIPEHTLTGFECVQQ